MERRRAPRIPAYRMPLRSEDGEVLGYALDLSPLGARVLCLADADLSAVTRPWLELPDWLGLGSRLELQGSFVWCRSIHRPSGSRSRPGGGSGSAGWREAGFVFAGLSGAARGMLEELVPRLLHAAREDGLLPEESVV